MAYQDNPELRSALERIEKTRGGVDEANSRLKPTLSAQASATWQNNAAASQGMSATSASAGQSTLVTPQLGVSLACPLDFSHQLKYGSEIATYQYQAQYLQMVSTAEQLVLQVKSAYFDLLRACGQHTVARAAVDDAQAQLTQTKDRFDAGTVPAFDLKSAEVNLANLQQQLFVAENQIRLSQTALNRVLGIDVNTPIQIRGVDIQVSTSTIDIPQSIELAYARRPELQMAQLGITQANTSVSLQRSTRLPIVSIGAGPTYNFNPSAVYPQFSWQVSVTASLPVFDGGQTRAKVRQAQADVQTSQDSLEQTQLAIAQDVRTAALNVQEATQRTQTTARAVALAEDALDLAKLRYGAGLPYRWK